MVSAQQNRGASVIAFSGIDITPTFTPTPQTKKEVVIQQMKKQQTEKQR